MLIRGEIQNNFLSSTYWCNVTIDVPRNSYSQGKANLMRSNLKVRNMSQGHMTCL